MSGQKHNSFFFIIISCHWQNAVNLNLGNVCLFFYSFLYPHNPKRHHLSRPQGWNCMSNKSSLYHRYACRDTLAVHRQLSTGDAYSQRVVIPSRNAPSSVTFPTRLHPQSVSVRHMEGKERPRTRRERERATERERERRAKSGHWRASSLIWTPEEDTEHPGTMPTVLGGKGKLSIVCLLLRYAYSQVRAGTEA